VPGAPAPVRVALLATSAWKVKMTPACRQAQERAQAQLGWPASVQAAVLVVSVDPRVTLAALQLVAAEAQPAQPRSLRSTVS
jgi:hypothetical protein